MTAARLQPQRGRDRAKARSQAQGHLVIIWDGRAVALVARCWPTTRQAWR